MNIIAKEFLAHDRAGLQLTSEGEWMGTGAQWKQCEVNLMDDHFDDDGRPSQNDYLGIGI